MAIIPIPQKYTVQKYLDLITSEHYQSPKYMAMIEAVLQDFVDNRNLIEALPSLFDLDAAIGAQLDRVGERLGRDRYLKHPITDIYFTFDSATLGFNSGVWWEPHHNQSTSMMRLDDESYRTLLYATVAADQWNGTIVGMYEALNTIFQPLGYQITIQDYGDMTMAVTLIGDEPLSAVTKALFTTGYLDLKPAGVRIIGHLIQSIPANPVFGFDTNNSSIAGFNTGVWAIPV